MNFAEKYDQLISQIEEAVKANEDEIAEKLSKIYGSNSRLIADAFQFISGTTLSQYIKQRRLVNAMLYKNEHDCSLETAAIKFGFPDAATMSKAFKACFGKSPSQMSKEELEAQQPSSLENISASEILSESNNTSSDIPFEIKEEIEYLARVNELSETEAIFAYELSKNRGITLDHAFDLVKDFASQEVLPMDNREFYGILDGLRAYLESEKVFVTNPFRMAEVERAVDILVELFPEKEKYIKDDPLQMGALILCVDSFDFTVRGEYELALFAEFCSLVDNFEVYSTGVENVHFAAVMQGAYKRIGYA